MRSRRTTVGLVVAWTALAAALVASVPPSRDVDATSIEAFERVFTANDNGSIAIFGNNLMTCPASAAGCATSRAAGSSTNNNGYDMVHLDQDGDSSTFSSSSAEVVLPADGEVRWAGLYWGARLGRGDNGAAATGDGTQMKLRGPGDGAYTTITAGHQFGPTGTSDRAYQAFADVTGFVRQRGTGSYFGADVPAATGRDRYAGWALVVVYRSPSMPLRNLSVFDGLADVGRDDPQTITISGFRTPVTGDVNTRLGIVAYEGDFGSTGDRARLSGTQLATTISPGTNFFNGANDDNGTYVTRRAPADRNMLGFDIKNFDAPGILANGATSATIALESTSERYFPGVVTTAIDVFAPDFSPSTKTVTNLTGGTPARVGDRLRYTVTFVNGGQDTAINTSMVDPIPPGTTFVPGSLAPPTGTFNTALNRIELQPGDFPVGGSFEFTFDVDVGSGAASTELANQATITYDGLTVPEFQDLTFTTRAASIAVIPSADVGVTKANTPATVVAGNVVTSTITVRNLGPSPATDVVITDGLPPGIGGVTALTSRGGFCLVTAVHLSCPIGMLAPNETVTVTVRTSIPPDSTAASVTDVARVASATSDPDSSNNTAPATTRVTHNADLSITKSAAPTTVTPGGLVTYTITVTNAGPSTATSVAITDAVPDPRLIVTGASIPAGPCPFDADGARCTVAALAPGASVTMTVTGRATPDAAPAGAVLSNLATVSSATPDSGPGGNSVTAGVTVGPLVPGLTAIKTASAPSPLVAGVGQVRYTVDVANTGPSDAEPVTFTDVLPAGFTVVSATSDRGSCTVTAASTGDTVACGLGALTAPFAGAPGGRARVTITAQVPAAVPAGTYGNTAAVQAPGAPPVASNDAPVAVTAVANVSVIKAFPQAAPDVEITPGQTETYRIRVVDGGPSVATDTVVADTLPAGLTPTAWRATVTPAGASTPSCDVATVKCELGDLPPGTTVELELDVFVDPGLVIDPAVGVANTVTATTASTDPNLADNTSTFTASGGAQADVSIRKLPPGPDREIFPVPAPVAGTNTSYIYEAINFGPSEAPNVVITDVLPPGTSFVRAFEPTLPDLAYDFCTGDGGDPETVTCVFPFDFPASVGTHLGIEVAVDPTVADGSVLTNTAGITSDADDGNTGNNTSTAVVSVRAVANLRLEKLVVEMDAGGNPILPPVPESADPLGLPPGRAVSFGLLVTNDGPSAAADVQVIDTVPFEGGNFPVGTCEFLTGDVVCSKTDGPLLPGDQFFTQLISLPVPETPQGVYTNTARVTTSTDETTLADNVDSRDVEIVDPVTDLIIDKTSLSTPLVDGETFTYQISVRAGLIDLATGTIRLSSDAEDVVVTDTLPAGLVPSGVTSSQGDCTIAGQDVRCDVGTVRAGVTLDSVQPVLVTVSGTVSADLAADQITNTAVATSSTALLGGAPSVSDRETTPLTRRADLAVTKVADSPTAAAGGGITFTVTVTNTGPSDATGVVVTDLLPAPLVYDSGSSDPSCALGAGRVACTIGTVAAGDSVSITIAATLPSNAAPGSVTNTASVASDVPDPDSTDNSASVPVAVTQAANLSVTKTPAAEGVLLGGTMAYTIVVVNDGPSDATAVVLTETIPSGTTVASASGCTGTGPLTCDLGDVVAGDTRTLDLVLQVPDTLSPGPLDNQASAASETADPDPEDASATATVEAVADADVTLTKELVTDPPIPGRPLEFRFTIVNNGPTVAPNASISDPLPPGTTFTSFTASQGTCQLDPLEDVAAASCTLGRMEIGATATATLIVDSDPGLRTVTNNGFSGSGGLDVRPLDNEDGVTVPLVPVSGLSVVKAGPAEVSSAAVVEYQLTYANSGPSTATDVVISDTLPSGLTPRPATGCTVAAQTVTCAIGVVGVGATGAVTVTADVSPGLALGKALTDVASIVDRSPGATDPDPSDNSSQLTSTVAAPNDVAVDVTADQVQVRAGDRASFTVVVTNNGPQMATGVTLVDTMPVQLATTSAVAGSSRPLPMQVPTGCLPTGATATCGLGDLAVGASRTIVFGGIVLAGTPAGTQLIDSATVTFDGVDAVEANNRDADVIVVVAVIQPATTTTTAPPSGGGAAGLATTGTAIGATLLLAGALVIMGGGLAGVRRSGRGSSRIPRRIPPRSRSGTNPAQIGERR